MIGVLSGRFEKPLKKIKKIKKSVDKQQKQWYNKYIIKERKSQKR